MEGERKGGGGGRERESDARVHRVARCVFGSERLRPVDSFFNCSWHGVRVRGPRCVRRGGRHSHAERRCGDPRRGASARYRTECGVAAWVCYTRACTGRRTRLQLARLGLATLHFPGLRYVGCRDNWHAGHARVVLRRVRCTCGLHCLLAQKWSRGRRVQAARPDPRIGVPVARGVAPTLAASGRLETFRVPHVGGAPSVCLHSPPACYRTQRAALDCERCASSARDTLGLRAGRRCGRHA